MAPSTSQATVACDSFHRPRSALFVRTSSLLSIAALACTVLAGCAQNARCPIIPGGPMYCLQDTNSVPPFNALQDIRIRRGDLDERMIAQLEVDATGMRLAGLTPMGQRVFDVVFDNKHATANSIADNRLDFRVLLALVQLAVWPRDRVEAALPSGFRLEEIGHERRLLHEDRAIAAIARSGEPPAYTTLDISISAAGLNVMIETIDEAY